MKIKAFFYLFFAITISLMAFKTPHIHSYNLENTNIKTVEGKAYWISYYNNGRDKKLYITQVYNNDCNHCNNEITTAFKKWLILNDYENTVSAVNIDNLNDIEEASLEKRRENTILKYKGYGYSIVRVGFSYEED